MTLRVSSTTWPWRRRSALQVLRVLADQGLATSTTAAEPGLALELITGPGQFS